jgi:hypothetical protein
MLTSGQAAGFAPKARRLVDLSAHCAIFSQLIKHYRIMIGIVNPAIIKIS